jgi:ribonuclease P protein component
MLKKEFRLRKQKDFERIFKKGFYFSEKFLMLKSVNNDLRVSRFGIIVSNKISKKASERNRTKRLLRESIRLLQKDIKPGLDCVFIAKDGIINKDFEEVKSSVEKLLRRSGLLE